MGLVVKNLPPEKSPGPGGLRIKFYKHLRNSTNSTQTLPGNVDEGNTSHSFCDSEFRGLQSLIEILHDKRHTEPHGQTQRL